MFKWHDGGHRAGWSMCGRVACPYVYYQKHSSTGDKRQRLTGSNDCDSRVSDHSPADLLLLDISVSVYTIFIQISGSLCECILKCIMSYECCWLCFCFTQFLCSDHSLASVLSFVCWNVLSNSSQIVLSLSVLWIFSNACACFFLCFHSLAVLSFWKAEGSLGVWVIFLHPRAKSIWQAPDRAISASKPWIAQICKRVLGDLEDVDKDTSSRKNKSPWRAFRFFCGFMFHFHSNQSFYIKNVLWISKNNWPPTPSINKLVFAPPKHPKSSGRTGMLQPMCVCYLCVHVMSCVLMVSFSGSRGDFLEVETSLKESKIETLERRRKVKEGQRGDRRLNKQRWWRLPS